MERVVIFDSDCKFCQNAVSFIRKNNKSGSFNFVPQQSDEGRSLINKFSIPPEDTNSVIHLTEERYVLRSTAVLHILKDMGGLWKCFYVFILVPSFIRDAVYRLVARYR